MTDPIWLLPAKFADGRGSIQSLIDGTDGRVLPGLVGQVQVITSVAGSVRGNHLHLTDWHLCHLVSGQMDYYWRRAGARRCARVEAGQAFLTRPGVEHAMHFLEDSVMVVVAGGQRDQERYEQDIVRVSLF